MHLKIISECANKYQMKNIPSSMICTFKNVIFDHSKSPEYVPVIFRMIRLILFEFEPKLNSVVFESRINFLKNVFFSRLIKFRIIPNRFLNIKKSEAEPILSLHTTEFGNCD